MPTKLRTDVIERLAHLPDIPFMPLQAFAECVGMKQASVRYYISVGLIPILEKAKEKSRVFIDLIALKARFCGQYLESISGGLQAKIRQEERQKLRQEIEQIEMPSTLKMQILAKIAP